MIIRYVPAKTPEYPTPSRNSIAKETGFFSLLLLFSKENTEENQQKE